MTSTSTSSRTRAGVLVLALALVGGTGCITAGIVENVREQNLLREQEAVRQDRIAKLAPAAEAGDPVAETDLAQALMAVRPPGQVDQQRVFIRLSRAANQGYGLAQALLGEMLVTNDVVTANFQRVPLAPAYQDRERGFRLLMQAATEACEFRTSEYQRFRSIHPALLLGSALEKAGRPDEALVWRARAALRCNLPDAQALLSRATLKTRAPQERMEALTLLLLTEDSARIAQAEATLPAEMLAAARRNAAELRRQIAHSLQQYPAPTRKEMQ